MDDDHAGHSHAPVRDAADIDCHALPELEAEYNMSMHVAAIFIIMAISFVGTMLPILGKKLGSLRFGDLPFQSLKLFGAGVILSTALIHMLTPANSQLTHPCAPEVFHEYGSWAGAIAVLGILFTQLVQLVGGNILRTKRERDASAAQGTQTLKVLEEGASLPTITSDSDHDPHPIHNHSPTHAQDSHIHSLLLTSQDATLSTLVLEAGIASHSIIIGLTLGVAREEFTSLLIALCFHQFFEGLALSSIVMDLPSLTTRRAMAIGMVLFYSFTTPIGIAIGIGARESFKESAAKTLVTMGVLDALAAGILLYDGLVNVIVPHFGGKRWKADSKGRQIVQVGFLWLGAFMMALIGKWA